MYKKLPSKYLVPKLHKMVNYRVFDEFVDFITSTPQLEQILSFRPSVLAQTRLEDLLEQKREKTLNEAEKYELNQFLLIEHLVRLCKANARKKLALR
jgi:hypothetical protein